jgi:hypothetical protein
VRIDPRWGAGADRRREVESPRVVFAETNWWMERPFSLASARHWSASCRAFAPWKPLPEAKHLYRSAGYEPQFNLSADPETFGPLAFTKNLHQGSDGSPTR